MYIFRSSKKHDVVDAQSDKDRQLLEKEAEVRKNFIVVKLRTKVKCCRVVTYHIVFVCNGNHYSFNLVVF